MSIKSYFAPIVVKTFNSKYNSQIKLVNFSGNLRLDMGNLTQSGKIIEKIWSKALNKLLIKDFVPKKVLILGFGAGSVAKVIAKKWPYTKITGVEIDPVVIKIAQKYFAVNNIHNLKIINQDAVRFIKKTKRRFNLVLVDCYQGYKIPVNFKNSKFLTRLGQVGDQILINRLFWDGHKLKTLKFLTKLRKSFATDTCRTPSNLVISIQV